MNKEQKLAHIQEVIGNKELTRGCKVTVTDTETYNGEEEAPNGEEFYLVDNELFVFNSNELFLFEESFKHEVIGHDVLIGDTLAHIENNNGTIALYEKTEYVICDVGDGPEKPSKLDNIPHDFTEWASHSEPITVLELINGLWGLKREPIQNQSDECIDYVYNLI